MKRRAEDKLLMGPPPPQDPRRPLYVGAVVVTLALTVGAYGLGRQDGRQAIMQDDRDVEYYKTIAERCTTAFDGLAFDATYAANLLREMQRDRQEQTDYADMMLSRELVVEAGP